MLSKNIKIVITGGPGGGKTTALDLFRREFGSKACIVPEAATTLFSSGIPRASGVDNVRHLQKAIFNFQHTLEDLISAQNQNKLLLCDRGTLDGLAYWPGDEDEFFAEVNSSFEQELARYDAVIFFETAAKAGKGILSNNPYRNEDNQEACALDQRLQQIWSHHPNYYLVESKDSFLTKIVFGIETIDCVVRRFTEPNGGTAANFSCKPLIGY